MITIQSAMLVALGFLVAALITLFVAPAYRRRAVRLTTDAIRRSMPLTEAEIRADKDKLRAEYAITVHRLETKVQEGALVAARQMVELNRRDAAISNLEGEVMRMRTSLEEHENARRVLEQTVTDRLPKVESRLGEAKKMLFHRDREISTLTQSADKQSKALDEMTQITTQQRDEIHRLNAALAARAARNRESIGDTRFDGEVALRSEIEALREKNRDQAAHITRLQGLVARRGGLPTGSPERHADINGVDKLAVAQAAAADGELQRLRSALDEAEKALRAAQQNSGDGAHAALEQQLRAAKTTAEDQASEITRLKAALLSYQTTGDDERGIKDSKMGMKAQISALKAQTDEQTATIQRLRAELAATNERMARQATHFRDEMRRLGAGTVPTTTGAEAKRSVDAQARRSLTSRINEPRSPRLGKMASAPPASGSTDVADAEVARVGGYLKAVDGGASAEAGASEGPASGDAQTTASAPSKPDRRPRLMERITGVDKSSA